MHEELKHNDRAKSVILSKNIEEFEEMSIRDFTVRDSTHFKSSPTKKRIASYKEHSEIERKEIK
jgi:hypothetical protein